ncbi:hypothetical protein O7627_01235 [Solwaraspora sp. WMMD1047]|uniref:hypothetical protein n=1 Tax=Solwaraspora sp. WMMD1047 TaxID=3016102 RepID=UPI0024163736|nr:hypothetical protein [Solwaraspora sp. WMMD1047]MDG4827923.1 hypothetical protein [Solwaraspora sp. WMMD1047]
MADETNSAGFPRRDADGRIVGLADLAGVVAAGFVIGLLALILFDWVFDLIGLGEFGRANGWLAVILPAWLFVEEFRAWRSGPARIAAALVAFALAIASGLLAAGLLDGVAPLWSGALAAAVATLAYAVVWFSGVRLLAGGTGGTEKKS